MPFLSNGGEIHDVVIVGAGLAGMCCAFELADRSRKVLVLEASSRCGGRTSSWTEEGMPVESGLHKFLGIYRDLPNVLKRAGIDLDAMLTWVDEIAILTPGGPNALFGAAPYHHPLRTLAGLVDNTEFVTTWDKLKLSQMGLAGLAKVASDPSGLDQISIARYARSFGLPEDLIRRLLFTLTQGVFFLPADEYSAYASFAPVVEGVKRGLTFRVGAFNGGMSEVMIDPLVRAIEARGGVVKVNEPTTRLVVDDGQIVAVETKLRTIPANRVVLAVPLDSAQQLLREAVGPQDWLQPMLQLGTHSAVTIQFELTAPLLDSDRTHFSPTGLCCFAEQSRTTFRHVPGRLSAILYPPERFLDVPDEAVAEHAYQEAASLGLPLREQATRFRVVRHAHDFYRLAPGSEALRPTQETPIRGLALAGDYTKQAFLASMEGAALAGRLAADAVLDSTVRPLVASPAAG